MGFVSERRPDLILLVLEREGHEFARAVLASEDPAPARALTESEPDITKSGSSRPFSRTGIQRRITPISSLMRSVLQAQVGHRG